MPQLDISDALKKQYDVCVVGAGAAGLALSQSVHAAGLSVILLERGTFDSGVDPVEHEIVEGTPHDPVAMTTRQGFGGTLNAWGGRCVPLDSADFGCNPDGSSKWPITFEDYARWIAPAAAFLGVQCEFERAVPSDWPNLNGVQLNTVELLAPGGLMSELRNKALPAPNGPDIALNCSVVGLVWSDKRATGVRCVVDGQPVDVSAGNVVLAAGGLQTARLLLIEAHRNPDRIAGTDWLGRTYMGHLTGSIAEIEFRDAADVAEFAYSAPEGGAPGRRRFLIAEPELPNIAIWVENLPASDARHRSGELSLKHLLSGDDGGSVSSHLRNVFFDLRGALAGVSSAARTRIRRDKRYANRLLIRGRGPYKLCYHAEHLPVRESQVMLSETTDDLGSPLLRIEFRYGSETIRGPLEAHQLLSQAARKAGFADIALLAPPDHLCALIESQARDGYHQIGLTRMAASPADGVVDENLLVFGTENVFVSSASALPVSGQANPTLSVVAFSQRLAAHLAGGRVKCGVLH